MTETTTELAATAKRTTASKPAALEGKGCLLYDEKRVSVGRLSAQNPYCFSYVSGHLGDGPDRYLTGTTVPTDRVTISPGANFISRETWSKILAHGQNKMAIERLQRQGILEWIEPEKIPGTDSILDFALHDALRILPRVYDTDRLRRWQTSNPPGEVWQAIENQLNELKERDSRIRTPEI